MTDTLDALAATVAAAEAAYDAASAAAGETRAERAKVARAIAALATEREAIKSRRAGGNPAEGDGARLAIIAVDTESLEAMLSDADRQLGDAQTRVQQANSALATANADYRTEECRLRLQAMDDHADHLLKLLAETIAQRLEAGAAMPRGQKAFERTTAQLAAFDRIASAQMHALRTASYGLGMYGTQARWMPSQILYDNVWRLHATDGSFA
jgi:hypothetical protein